MPSFLEAVAGGLVRLGVKVVGNAIGFSVAGDLAVGAWDVIWGAWNQDCPQEQDKKADLLQVIQATPAQYAKRVVQITRQVAQNKPQEVQEALAAVLQQVPSKIRQSFRRVADPTGLTVPTYLRLQKAEDLQPLIPDRLPRLKAGQYPLAGVNLQLTEQLGVGGFGEVWKARNPQYDGLPPVALKFCLVPSGSNRILEHEASVINRVMREGRHPGIVELRQVHLDADPPFLEYEYVTGGELTSWIQEWSSLPTRPTPNTSRRFRPRPIEIATMVGQLAGIVGFAHGLTPPIVHRDLKPANILIEGTRQEYHFRITDFGIGGVASSTAIGETSHRHVPSLARASMVSGSYTPLYASPQQMRGEPPDPRDDVFALGVIWYQMMTCDLTKGAPTGRGWVSKIIEQGMPKTLVELLADCTSNDPDERPANAAYLFSRLVAFFGSRSAHDHYDEGCIYQERDELEKAIGEFTEAIRLDPKHALAYRGRGSANYDLILDRRWHLRYHGTMWTQHTQSPDYAEADLSLEMAVSDLNEAIHLDPKLSAAYEARALCYSHDGLSDQAIADFKEAIRLDPKNDRAINILCEYYVHCADECANGGNYADALAAYNAALELDPEKKDDGGFGSEFFEWRGTAYFLDGQVKEAIKDYVRLIKASGDMDEVVGSPSDKEEQEALDEAKDEKVQGDVLWAKQEYQEAVKRYNTAVEMEPGFTKAIVENMEVTLSTITGSAGPSFDDMMADPTKHADALHSHMSGLRGQANHPQVQAFEDRMCNYLAEGSDNFESMYNIWEKVGFQWTSRNG